MNVQLARARRSRDQLRPKGATRRAEAHHVRRAARPVLKHILAYASRRLGAPPIMVSLLLSRRPVPGIQCRARGLSGLKTYPTRRFQDFPAQSSAAAGSSSAHIRHLSRARGEVGDRSEPVRGRARESGIQ